jgi:hypothetical protein
MEKNGSIMRLYECLIDSLTEATREIQCMIVVMCDTYHQASHP